VPTVRQQQPQHEGSGGIGLSGGRFTYDIQIGDQPALNGNLYAQGIALVNGALTVQNCNFPTNVVGTDFFDLNPNTNPVECSQ
jgi:hypothetical protein